MTNALTQNALPDAAQSTGPRFFQRIDPDAIVTPTDLRRHVAAALRERAETGDKLAEGALKVIAHLEHQANALAWQATGAAYEDYRKSDIDHDLNAALVRP